VILGRNDTFLLSLLTVHLPHGVWSFAAVSELSDALDIIGRWQCFKSGV